MDVSGTYDPGMDATVASAGTALVGALLGSLGAPLLQGRLADRTSLRNERMELYARAMLYVHFVGENLRWLVAPYDNPGVTEDESRQLKDLKQVPDQITARMQLLGHKRVRDAWLELVHAEEGLQFQIGEDNPGFRQSGSDPMEALPYNYPPLARLRTASEHFERCCRKALHVSD